MEFCEELGRKVGLLFPQGDQVSQLLIVSGSSVEDGRGDESGQVSVPEAAKVTLGLPDSDVMQHVIDDVQDMQPLALQAGAQGRDGGGGPAPGEGEQELGEGGSPRARMRDVADEPSLACLRIGEKKIQLDCLRDAKRGESGRAMEQTWTLGREHCVTAASSRGKNASTAERLRESGSERKREAWKAAWAIVSSCEAMASGSKALRGSEKRR